ncbi:MAG: transcription termination/antitermination protein NusA [Chloroflexi bacterium]|nr:transcription termination/antitermination protein NusA [Chloroflexota bacterium]
MKSDFTLAFNEILETRALSKEVVLEALEQALVSAYRRDANIGSNQQKIQAQIDLTGHPQIFVEKEVVSSIVDNRTEVLIDEARKQNPDCELGDMVMAPVMPTSASFGRIAAQTAKQVILQRIREAERDALYDEFIDRQGDLVTGTVQSTAHGVVTLSLGRAEAIMPKQHQMPNERYKAHDKIRAFVAEVNKSTRGPQIIVSRAHKDMLRRLLEYEVPEIYNGQVEIKNIAREAGYRSKVAVAALQEGIDPVGACVGMRGMRIQNIIKELHDEKIDVIEWDPDPARFISKALSPARVSGVYLHEDIDHVRTALVVVPEDNLSLAIGREGQNARLAAKLTGWRIDIKSVTEAAIENIAALSNPPLNVMKIKNRELVTEVERILEKKRTNRPVNPEEYTTLTTFVNVAQRLVLDQRDGIKRERQSLLDSVRPLVPAEAFNMPIAVLELADDIVKALGKIETVGELMVRVLADEQGLARMLVANKAGDDAMEAIQYALDDLVIPEILQAQEIPAPVEEAPVTPAPVVEKAAPVVEVQSEGTQPIVEEEEDILRPAFPDIPAPVVEESQPREKRRTDKIALPEVEEIKAVVVAADWEEPEEEEGADERLSDKRSGRKKKTKVKKAKQSRVQLVFDEDMGEVVAKRRRKGNRDRGEFDEFDTDEEF